jgi:hypothetical protein
MRINHFSWIWERLMRTYALKILNLMALATGLLLLASLSFALEIRTGGAPLAATFTASPAAVVPSEPPITLTVVPDFKHVRIGDPAAFNVHVQMQPEYANGQVDYGKKIGAWDVQTATRGRLKVGPGRQLSREDHLVLTTYEAGDVEFPAIILKFPLANGQTGEFRSAAFKVKVDPLPPKPGDKPGQVRGLKGPIGLIPLWLVVLTLLLLAAGAYLIWRFETTKKSRDGESRHQEPARPPEVVARERLAALQQSAWLADGEMKPFYIELTDILRRYLEGRFRISAIDRTTHELMRELKNSVVKRQDQAVIRDVLEESDMVKFAKSKPEARAAETALLSVADLVERTSVAAEAPVASTPGGAA